MIAADVVLGRWRLARNTFFARGGRMRSNAGRPLLGGTLAVVLSALVFMGLGGIFGQLASQGISAADASATLGLIVTAALGGMLIFDLQEAVTTLVLDSDLELLRRAPIRPRALFIMKLVDALPRTSVLLVVLAIPTVFAYHVFYPLPWWSWFALPLQLAALWAIPLGLGIAIAIQTLRYVPPRRAREALGLLSTLTLFVLWLANSFLFPRFIQSGEGPLGPLRTALTGASPVYRLSPGRWMAESLAAAANGEWQGTVRATLTLAAIGAVSLVLAGWVAARHLESVQALVWGGGAKRSRATPERARDLSLPTTFSNAVSSASHDAPKRSLIRAVIARDGKLLMRDWTVLGDVLTTAVLWTLLPLVGAPLYHAAPHVLGLAMLLALTVGLGYEVAARAIPFEREATVWMRLAPVRASRWLLAKWIGTAIVSTPLILIAAISMSITLGLTRGEVVQALCVTLPALALALSAGLWTGATYGNWAWANPRAMLSLTGRAVATLVLVAQAGMWLVLSALIETDHEFLPPGIIYWGPVTLAAILSMVPLAGAARRLERRAWTA